MSSDLLQRKETHFVLWHPYNSNPAPKLVIGRLVPGNPATFADRQIFDLRPSDRGPDPWEIPADACNLKEGEVYHYWFEVSDSNPSKNPQQRILCTDPTAWTVDWRLRAPRLQDPYGADDQDPPGVVKYENGRLVPCDPGGETIEWRGDASSDTLPPNNRLVIYELPTAWSRLSVENNAETGVGTFRDVISLVERGSEAANFIDTVALQPGRAHLLDLGVNALELLPPADSFVDREWGYATSTYFAPDFDLGFPRGHLSPTASSRPGCTWFPRRWWPPRGTRVGLSVIRPSMRASSPCLLLTAAI